MPRGVYIIFLGFFKNSISPISGRYLQTSALKMLTKFTQLSRSLNVRRKLIQEL